MAESVYTGNAGLGLGSNPNILPVPQGGFDQTQGAAAQVYSTLADTRKNIALMDFQLNDNLFKQKVKDRDALTQMLDDGDIKVGAVLPNDKKLIDDAKADVDKQFYDMIKKGGLNNPDAMREYKTAVHKANNIATQAQLRYKYVTEENQGIAGTTLPGVRDARKANLDNYMKGDFWNPPQPYQQQGNFDPDALGKLAKVSGYEYNVDEKGNPLPTGQFGPAKVTGSKYDYKGTVDAMAGEYLNGKENALSMDILHGVLDGQDMGGQKMSLPERQSAIKAINTAVDLSNDPNIKKVAIDPATGKIMNVDKDGNMSAISPYELAAKYEMGMHPASSKTEFNKDYADLKEKTAHDKAMEAIDWAKVGIEKNKADAQVRLWDSKTGGTAQTKSEALNYAKNLYGQIGQLADKQNIITPDKVRQLTAEQLKYLGLYTEGKRTVPVMGDDGKTPISGAKVEQTGLVPLTLGENDLIRLENGVIRVMKDAKYDAKAGVWRGTWDNTRTTSVTNIATNRVNEENKLSGGKETNNYLGIDGLGGDGEQGTATDGGGQVIDLTGTEDPSALKVGQVYNLPGTGVVKWNGKNLVKQK